LRSAFVPGRRLLAAGVVLLGFVCPVAAITEGKETTSLVASESVHPAAKPTDPVVIKAVPTSYGLTGRAGLADRITVSVRNFDAVLAKAGECNNIVLFINGMPLRAMPPESCDVTHGTIRFQLYRTEKSDAAWHALLSSPSGFIRPVALSVGANDQFSYPTTVTKFPLEVIPQIPFYVFTGLFVAITLAFVLVCIRSSMIRSGKSLPGKPAPFSLSKFQMAFWTFLVVIAYIFLWLITDELDTITDSVLALIGIGAGTALGSAIMESTKKDGGAGVSAETVATVAAQQAQAGAPSPIPVVTADATAERSRGFLRDVLSEGDGIAFHRLQMFVWTLVLGMIFVVSVYQDLAMPVFSSTLLALIGISAGTYLGFKIPEGSVKE
jgi:hypothetical protein